MTYQLCNCKKPPVKMILEADYNSVLFSCESCGYRVSLENLPLSTELKAALQEWSAHYGEWLKLKDNQIGNRIELETRHNKRGKVLTNLIKKELGSAYEVKFSPTFIIEMYLTKEKT